jgi:phage FluMu protein Com
MMAKCPHCKHVVRINEHRVFLTHTTVREFTKNKEGLVIEMKLDVCKGSYTKTVFVEP